MNCSKCGKPKFGPWTTVCTAMVQDPRYMEMYCYCAEISNFNLAPRFPVGRCKHCGQNVLDAPQDGQTIIFCSYECYCMD
jgi:hypothetical protein